MAKDSVTLDFTNVKDGAKFSKKHLPAGDYKARVKSYEKTMPKDKNDKTPMWLFTIELVDKRGASYPYYCKLQENQLWKIRNLFGAAGITIPKKRVTLDPSRIVGKIIGVTLEDEEYEGKMQSVVDAVIPASEVDGTVSAEDDEDEETDDEADDTEDDDEDEDEDSGDTFDGMDRTELKQYIAKSELGITVKKSMSDDDIRELIRAAQNEGDDEDEEDDEEPEEAPKARKKKKARAASDDELEELEIDEL